ncbi:MAG: beta-N-acetylhexosaminidase [Dongiaceae bacterium]
MRPAAAILGCHGTELTAAERRFYRSVDPLGFILFARNVADPAQLRALVADLRESVGRADAPVLVDQEGGRVARMRPPHWPARPAAGKLGELHARRGPEAACAAARLDGRLIAADVAEVGIDVLCAPVLDLRVPGAHEIVVGDRSFASDPAIVGALAGSFIDGVTAGGVIPMLKHMPGHGRAVVDSHHELPVVDAPLSVLAESDFLPFRQHARRRIWGITCHIVFRALDPQRPATLSRTVIGGAIRGAIGFDGLLLTDDLSMKALGGTYTERTRRALDAGIDVALHCNGDPEEMRGVADGLRPLSDAAMARIARSRPAPAEPCDRAALQAELDRLLAA